MNTEKEIIKKIIQDIKDCKDIEETYTDSYKHIYKINKNLVFVETLKSFNILLMNETINFVRGESLIMKHFCLKLNKLKKEKEEKAKKEYLMIK